jgi:PIN domain nuclease of toxin-antitoxin system
LYEIGQKVRLKKWPEAEPLVSRLPYVILDSGIKIVGIDEVQSLRAGLLDWAHRDPFDRLVAAAAMEQRLVLVSIDTAFDGVVDRIW